MMQEKTMVSDALNSINSGMKTLTDMISQTENQELRSALQQMRNESEKSQYELYNLAKSLNYYMPAQKANQEEVNSLKVKFAGGTAMAGGMGTTNQMSSGTGMGSSMGMNSGTNMGSSMGMNSGTNMGSSMGNNSGTNSGIGMGSSTGMNNKTGK
jgi:hypothetical protein